LQMNLSLKKKFKTAVTWLYSCGGKGKMGRNRTAGRLNAKMSPVYIMSKTVQMPLPSLGGNRVGTKKGTWANGGGGKGLVTQKTFI